MTWAHTGRSGEDRSSREVLGGESVHLATCSNCWGSPYHRSKALTIPGTVQSHDQSTGTRRIAFS